MRQSAWHSTKSDFYHVCSGCESGRLIPLEDVRPGPGNRPLCKECQRLINRGHC